LTFTPQQGDWRSSALAMRFTPVPAEKLGRIVLDAVGRFDGKDAAKRLAPTEAE
jgi:hypothetical protein